MALAYRPPIKFGLSSRLEKDVGAAVADHERFRFASVTVTNATNARNFSADKYLAIIDNAGTAVGYLPVKAAVW